MASMPPSQDDPVCFDESEVDPPVLRRLRLILGRLPAMSIAVQHTLELLSTPSITVQSVAASVEQDQVMAARVLRLVNSPFFGLERQVTSIKQAVILLGFNTIRQMVLSLGMNRTFQKMGKNFTFDMDLFWTHSIVTGILAKKVAKKVPGVDVESAFAAGLLHDIGKVILYMAFGEAYHKIHRGAAETFTKLSDLEVQTLSITHSQAGYVLGKRWNFPKAILHTILLHHQVPPFVLEYQGPVMDEERYRLIEVVALADLLATMIGHGLQPFPDYDVPWSHIAIAQFCEEYTPPERENLAFLKQEVEEVVRSYLGE